MDLDVGASCPGVQRGGVGLRRWSRRGQLTVGTELRIGADDGALQWASPIADGTHYQSTSIAGGVAFTVDNQGELLAWDVATGAPLSATR